MTIRRRLAFYTVTGRHPLHLSSTIAVTTPGPGNTTPTGTATGPSSRVSGPGRGTVSEAAA